jgi:hypothetical protein
MQLIKNRYKSDKRAFVKVLGVWSVLVLPAKLFVGLGIDLNFLLAMALLVK